MRKPFFPILALLLGASPALGEDYASLMPCRNAPGVTPPTMSDAPQAEKYFPAISQILGEAGDVQLNFIVETNGKVADPHVEKSSGFARLDAAALQIARLWRYKPASVNGERIICVNRAIVKWTIPAELGHISPARMIVPAAESWPAGAREEGVEGVTAVRADVAPDGKVKTQIVSSSGSRDLDKEAVARVLARPDVKPDIFDDKPVGARFTFYVIWSLTPVRLPEKSVPAAPAN